MMPRLASSLTEPCKTFVAPNSKTRNMANASDNIATLSPAAEAYLWGYPLVATHRTRLHLCSRHPSGELNHVKGLATPLDKAIVAPNNDTLYTSGWYDLRHGDLVIEVPPMDKPDRYWNVMIADAYTHVTYIARRHHGTRGTRVIVRFDPSVPPLDTDTALATVGTPTAWVIIRVLVESKDDLEAARKIQRAIRVTANIGHPKILTERAGRANQIARGGSAIFEEIHTYMSLDPPAKWHPPLSQAASDILRSPSSASNETLTDGIEEAEELLAAGNTQDGVLKHGWRTGRGTGGPGDDILRRATGAKYGLGGHYPIENRSYIAVHASNGAELDGNRPLKLKFASNQLPPCAGFWSLTAYGMDLYLVENAINRWSISDRTPGLRYEEDGGLIITLSAAAPCDPSNWLPVPKGPFMLGMRVYEGEESVLACQWFPPPLQPTD